MRARTVGIIIAVLAVVLALVILVVSNKVEISKKQTDKTAKTDSTASSVVTQEERVATDANLSDTESVAEEVATKAQTVVIPEPEKAPVEEVPELSADADEQSIEPATEAVSYDIGLQEVIDQSKLSYDGDTQELIGTVADKKCYLQDNQIVFCVDIQIVSGVVSQSIAYYCTYSTYESLSVSDKLKVLCKQTTEHTFAVISVERA